MDKIKNIDLEDLAIIKEFFNKEILNNARTQNIKENLSAEHIKLEVMARNKANKIVERALKKIERMINAPIEKKKIVYR